MTSALAMTLDVKALSKEAPKVAAAMVSIDNGGGASTLLFRSASMARRAADLLNALPALLDRLERAEAMVVLAREYMDALAAFSAHCDSNDDLPAADYYRHQSTVTAARSSLRAALDDEAPR